VYAKAVNHMPQRQGGSRKCRACGCCCRGVWQDQTTEVAWAGTRLLLVSFSCAELVTYSWLSLRSSSRTRSWVDEWPMHGREQEPRRDTHTQPCGGVH